MSSACSSDSDTYFTALHRNHHREAAICLIHTWSVMSCSLLYLELFSLCKVDKHVCKVHIVAIRAQQLLSTHLMCRSLACGGRHAAEPRKNTGASFGHIRWGVRGGVRAAGPTASV